jgi:hypothetical protein
MSYYPYRIESENPADKFRRQSLKLNKLEAKVKKETRSKAFHQRLNNVLVGEGSFEDRINAERLFYREEFNALLAQIAQYLSKLEVGKRRDYLLPEELSLMLFAVEASLRKMEDTGELSGVGENLIMLGDKIKQVLVAAPTH